METVSGHGTAAWPATYKDASGKVRCSTDRSLRNRATKRVAKCPSCGKRLRGFVTKEWHRQKVAAARESVKARTCGDSRRAMTIDYFSVQEAAAILGMTMPGLRLRLLKGTLEGYKMGRHWRIPARALLPALPLKEFKVNTPIYITPPYQWIVSFDGQSVRKL